MSLVQTLVYILSALLSISLGTFALFQNKTLSANRFFFLFTLSQFFWISSLYLGYTLSFQESPNLDHSIIFFRLAFAFGILMIFILAAFFYYFPRITIAIPRTIRWIFIALAISTFCISAFTPLVHESQYLIDGVYNDTDIFGPLYPYYNHLNLFLFITSAILAFQKIFYLHRIEKLKITISAIGGWSFLIITSLTNVILPLLGIWQIGPINVGFLIRISPLFTLLFLIPTFFSIRRYRFFNFSNTSLNSLRIVIIFLFYSSAVISSYFILGYFVDQGLLKGIISAIIGLSIYEIIKGKIPILVTSSFKHFKDNLAEFKSKIYHCDTYKKMDKLVENVFLLNLNFITARIFAVRNSSDDIGLSTYNEGKFSHIIADHFKDAITIDEIDFRKKLNKSDKKLVKKEMHKLDADLCLPLFSESKLIGFFILKQKNSSDPYSKEELNEILKIKKDLEIGLMNILLKMNLQEENNLMKSIIDKKTSQLKKNIEEVNEVLEQQSDFIAVTAHEFRTPITIASFQLEDILNSKKKPKEASKELKIVQDSINNLKNLTEKLFAVQQYDLNKVTLNTQKICLNNFIKALHQEFLPLMKEKELVFDLKIKTKKKIFVKIDKLQMRQVMHNLLKNASKFTPENGKVAMIMEVSKKNVLIKVDDNGAGINNQLKETIFDKFRTQAAGAGIGLGLYLCKKIIHLHKGKIWVEDSPMGGASFCIELKSTIK